VLGERFLDLGVLRQHGGSVTPKRSATLRFAKP
jgi:hypothetical protein